MSVERDPLQVACSLACSLLVWRNPLARCFEVVLLQQPNKNLQNSFYEMKLTAKETAKNKTEIF
jgi:hypothetical protein